MPLLPPPPKAAARASRRASTLGWVLASAALHGALLLLAFALPRPAVEASKPVEIALVETEPPPPPPPPEQKVETQPEVKPAPPKPVVRPQPVEPEPPPSPPPELKADPVDEPPPVSAPRRVVGLSLESTVATGEAAFAVGNTRMGQTAEVAQEPTAESAGSDAVQPPRRTTSPEPDYPPELRARGVEGDVGLEVEVGSDGLVKQVTVRTPSGFEPFDRAAEASARASAYEPARLGGAALTYVIRFTVRFRLRKGGPP